MNNKKQPLLINFLSEDAAENAGNFVMRKFLHQQIKQYIFLSCLLSDHELLDCLLHLFTLCIIIYSFLQFFCICIKTGKIRQIGFEPILTGLKPCASTDWAIGA